MSIRSLTEDIKDTVQEILQESDDLNDKIEDLKSEIKDMEKQYENHPVTHCLSDELKNSIQIIPRTITGTTSKNI